MGVNPYNHPVNAKLAAYLFGDPKLDACANINGTLDYFGCSIGKVLPPSKKESIHSPLPISVHFFIDGVLVENQKITIHP